MRFLIITLSLLSSILCYSQEQTKPFEQVLDWSGSLTVKSITDSSKYNTCVLAHNSSKLKAFLFDRQMQFKKEFQIGLTDENVVGGYINAQQIQIYLKTKGADWIHNVSINTETGDVVDTTFQMELKGMKFVGQVSAGGSFLYVAVSKKTPVFHVYKFSGGALEEIDYDLRTNKLDHHLPNGNLWEALSSASGISRSLDIAIVNPYAECEVDVASSRNKLYLRNDSLTLVMDSAPQRVLLLNLGLNSKQVSARAIKRYFAPIKPEDFDKPVYNSFLIKDNLYSVQATSDSLNLLVQQFQTGRTLKNYRAMVSDSIHFKNTPIIQEGGGSIYSAQSERSLAKTKQLLRKMQNGDAVITGIANSKGQDELTIGAYKKITQNTGGFAPGGMGGMAMGAGVALTFTPGFGGSWSKVVRFKSLVDPISASHIAGEMHESVSEQIQNYTESMNISSRASEILIVNDFYQFSYYDKNEKKLVVMKFQ